jgi:hypothetical protein
MTMNLDPNLLDPIPWLHQVPWFLPSLYGDIRLTAQGSSTEVEWEDLSPTEREALAALSKKFDVGFDGDSGKLTLNKPIAKVEAVLAKAMKRGRKLLSAVVFKNGKIEELHRTEGGESPKQREPYREPAEKPSAIEKVAAAVTVAAPTRGCPVPEFERAEVRATAVLRAFLSGQQLADFERTQSFLVTGGDTGRQYVLTSRQAPPERLAKVGGRSVFDVTAGMPVCVHDWVVPAAEELLELKLFLELPNREQYARGLLAQF